MLEKSPTETLAEYYKKYIFAFPSIPKLTLLITSTSLIAIISSILIDYNIGTATIVSLLAVYIPVITLSHFVSKVMNLKRRLGLILSYNLFFIPSVIICLILFKLNLLNHYNLLLSIQSCSCLSYFIIYLALRALGENIVAISILTSITLLVLTAYNHLLCHLGMVGSLSILIVSFLATISIVELFLRRLNTMGIKTLNINGLKLFRAFSYFLLLHDRCPLEKLLKVSISSRKVVEVLIVGFERMNGSIKGILVLPTLHPGPFRNLGSSDLPNVISSEFDKYDVTALTLHRASSHEYDAVDSSEVTQIVKQLVSKTLSPKNRHYVKVSKPCIVKENDFLVISQLIDNYLLSIVTRFSKGLEDIPHEIEQFFSPKDKINLVVVDSHSNLHKYLPNIVPKPGTPEFSKIGKLIVKSYKLLDRTSLFENIIVGISRIRVEEDVRKGIGKDGVSCIILQVPNQQIPLILLLFDANNMLINVKNELYRILSTKYNDAIIMICTTDNHKLSGILPGVKYYPLGEKISVSELLKLSIKAIESAYKNCEVCKVFVVKHTSRLHMLGNEGLYRIYRFVHYGVRTIINLMKIMISLIIFNIFLMTWLSIMF